MATAIRIDGAPTGNAYIDGLIFGGKWTGPSEEPVNITYKFMSGPDPYGLANSAGNRAWTDAEKSAFRTAAQTWEAVANIRFTEVTDTAAPANMWEWMSSTVPASAQHNIPAYSGSHPVYGWFNTTSYYIANGYLAQGGMGFKTYLHEIGHGLGLDHTHDSAQPFAGVVKQYDLGDFGLNQGIFSAMSYNAGWNGQAAVSNAYGWNATPGAFDIAAMQKLYGANMSTGAGNSAYQLPTANALKTFWSCIWDAGGSDTLSAVGARNSATLDLRDAPLVGPNAGGYVSWIKGVVGGFTIANGVMLENAIGGNYADRLNGNCMDNVLTGNGGNDWLCGCGGRDTLIGGAGNDTLNGNAGSDTFVFATVLNALTNIDVIQRFTSGVDVIRLDDAVMPKLASGALAAENFVRGAAALDASDYIIFNPETGALSYDADGSGTGVAVQFAAIDLATANGLPVVGDFMVT